MPYRGVILHHFFFSFLNNQHIILTSAKYNSNILLVFDTEYVYNCPDGFTDGDVLPATIPGYSGYQGKYNYSVIKGVQLKQGDSSYTLNFPANNSTDKPYYNQIDNLYNIKQHLF